MRKLVGLNGSHSQFSGRPVCSWIGDKHASEVECSDPYFFELCWASSHSWHCSICKDAKFREHPKALSPKHKSLKVASPGRWKRKHCVAELIALGMGRI
jgi:hypothetical protein